MHIVVFSTSQIVTKIYLSRFIVLINVSDIYRYINYAVNLKDEFCLYCITDGWSNFQNSIFNHIIRNKTLIFINVKIVDFFNKRVNYHQ
jgi:hypothetical protein